MIHPSQWDLDWVGVHMVILTMDMAMVILIMDTVMGTVIHIMTGTVRGDIPIIIRVIIGVDIMMDITMAIGMVIMDIHMIHIPVIHTMGEEICPLQVVDTVPTIAI